MVIDFHTHIFPESIAARAIKELEIEGNVNANTDGTLHGLIQSMQNAKVTHSVVLPVVTKPSQFESINEYSRKINNQNGIIAFGGIHPDNTNIKDKLHHIKAIGLKGIKLHPDYQGPTYIDDEKYINIIKECINLDLCVVIHAGMDVGKPYPIHCPPDRSLIMLNEVLKKCEKEPKIILAHMGGMLQWRLVEEFLVGKNVYFDFAYCNILSTMEQNVSLIKKHGADKILFATDSPWSKQEDAIRYINELPISHEEKEMILYKNAARLLNI